MNEQLMVLMGNLQDTTNVFLEKYSMGGFKAPMIRQHLRTAYEWILNGDFSRAQLEIDLAKKKMT